jgi:fatty-acyl-CoA synthase
MPSSSERATREAAMNPRQTASERSPARLAGFNDIAQCIASTAARQGRHIAVDDGARALDYAEFDRRAWAAAAALRALGIAAGDRVAVLAENRIEYLELALAAARTGGILAALNWRFSAPEIAHCVRLTAPALVFVSQRFLPLLREAAIGDTRVIVLEDGWDALLEPALAAGPARLACTLDPEDGYIILYTSGTTGMSKAALISHRAEVARLALGRIDSLLAPGDNFVAWAPLFHMVALEHALHVLALGGTVHVVDGADIDRIVDLALRVPQWWLVLLPGMIDRVVDGAAENRRCAGRPRQPRSRRRDLAPVQGAVLEHLRVDGNRHAAVRRHALRPRRAPRDARQGRELEPPVQARRRRGSGGGARPAGRGGRARADDLQRLLARRGDQRARIPRRLVPHG